MNEGDYLIKQSRLLETCFGLEIFYGYSSNYFIIGAVPLLTRNKVPRMFAFPGLDENQDAMIAVSFNKLLSNQLQCLPEI
jgi:hypothetical protein